MHACMHIWVAACSENEVFYAKFHWKTNQGIKNLSSEEAERLAGTDPDYATRDLFNAIERGDFPSWTLYIQVNLGFRV